MVNNIKTNTLRSAVTDVEDRQKVEKGGGTFGETLAKTTGPRRGARFGHVGGRAAQPQEMPMARPSSSGKLITHVQAERLARFAPIINEASQRFKIDKALICAIITQESGGNPNAVSHCGARGLMQLMPGTAKRMGVSNSHDPYQNIMGGTKYLRFLLDRFEGNISLAVAGYNAGEGNVAKYGNRIPPFAETRAYVPNVLKYADTYWNIFRSNGTATTTDVRRVDTTPPAQLTHRTILNLKG